MTPPSWEQVAQAYPVNRRYVWLNNCGTTPAGQHVVERMQDYHRVCAQEGPGAGEYTFGAVGRELKSLLGSLLNAHPDEIALVHNTAEAMNMVSFGLRLALGDQILLVENEYPSNVYPWEYWQARGAELKFVALAATPDEFYDNFRRALTPRSKVAALSVVHWCTGLPLPIERVAALCRDRGILLALDGSQAVGQLPVDVRALGPCVVAFSAWKWLLGPVGLGVLVVSRELLDRLDPVFKGPDAVADPASYLPYQTQLKPTADRYRYSTANFNDWVYLSASLEFLHTIGFEQVYARIHHLTAELWQGLEALGFQSAYARASAPNSGILAVEKLGVDCRVLVRLLGERGIIARERSGRLRLGPHVYIEPEGIARTVAAIAELAAEATG